MIIDAHTHIYTDFIAKKALQTVIDKTKGLLTAHTDGTYKGLLKSTIDANIDFSIVQLIATNIGHGKKILNWIEPLMKESNRIQFFTSIYPGDPDTDDILLQSKNLGIKGIKFHAPYQNFNVDSKEVYPLYEKALNQGLILHFHAGLDRSNPNSDSASIPRFARLLKDFSNCKIILAHGGGDSEWDKVLELLSDKSCYFDTSFILDEILSDSFGVQLLKLKADYFIFGTDSPWKDQKAYIQLLKESIHLNKEQKEKIFSRNLLKLF